MQKNLILVLLVASVFLIACYPTPTVVLPSPTVPTSTLEPIILNSNHVEPVLTLTRLPMPTRPLPTLPPTATPVIYAVQEGDTLLGIAYKFNVTLEALLLANPTIVPELLQIGQSLVIPELDLSNYGVDNLLIQPPTPPPSVWVRNVGLYETPVGGIWVLGEVVNESGVAVENVSVSVTLFDDSGDPNETRNTLIARSVIFPSESSPFGILFPEPKSASSSTRYRADLIDGESMLRQSDYNTDLTIENVHTELTDNMYHITGDILNPGEYPAYNVTMLVTLYNAENQVTGFRITLLLDDLLPAEQAPFDIRLTPAGPGTVQNKIIVWGWLYYPEQ